MWKMWIKLGIGSNGARDYLFLALLLKVRKIARDKGAQGRTASKSAASDLPPRVRSSNCCCSCGLTVE
jgi:hypothetical protein